LVSTSKGYFVADTVLDINLYIRSLEERISAINAVRLAMCQQYAERVEPTKPIQSELF